MTLSLNVTIGTNIGARTNAFPPFVLLEYMRQR